MRKFFENLKGLERLAEISWNYTLFCSRYTSVCVRKLWTNNSNNKDFLKTFFEQYMYF